MVTMAKAIIKYIAPILILMAVMALTSRYIAIHKADSIMRHTFSQGWFRGNTKGALWLNDTFHPCWLIQYEKDDPVAYVDFGPQLLMSWSGNVISMSPTDLIERINKSVEQAGPGYPPQGVGSPDP